MGESGRDSHYLTDYYPREGDQIFELTFTSADMTINYYIQFDNFEFLKGYIRPYDIVDIMFTHYNMHYYTHYYMPHKYHMVS